MSRGDAGCEEECATDGDCSGQQKCCYNGCGRSCLQAAEDPGMVRRHNLNTCPHISVQVDYDEDTVTPVNPNAPIIEVVETPVFVAEGDIASLGVRVRGNPQASHILTQCL